MSSATTSGPALVDVPVGERSLEGFAAVLDAHGLARLQRGIEAAQPVFDGRTVWNINSTANGGGVAEMLRPLLGYARGVGVSAHWEVVSGNPEFFAITKRLHNHLHGSPGDGGSLGEREREVYSATLVPAAHELMGRAQPGDLVLLHDPQTAGMAPILAHHGFPVVWRCHIGADLTNDLVRGARRFLAPDVRAADKCVFSRPAYAWQEVPRRRVAFVMPSIDPFAAKNAPLDPVTAAAILGAAAITDGAPAAAPTIVTVDAGPVTITRPVEGARDGPLPTDARFVLQVSRWDDLKDPLGVITAFADHVAAQEPDVHLVHAGPTVDDVSDDPEGEAVYTRAVALRDTLPPEIRRRVHLLLVPMADATENALVVSALQHRATVVLQKSIAEGFGLTVTEAMWKARPIVASAVGGIVDQIDNGRCGLLVDDPRDLAATGAAIVELLRDPVHAAEMGAAARERVRRHFLSDRSLIDYLRVLAPLAATHPRSS